MCRLFSFLRFRLSFRFNRVVGGAMGLLLGQAVLAQPNLDQPGADGEDLDGHGGNAVWITVDGDDYPNATLYYSEVDLGGGRGEDGGDGILGGMGGNGGRLTLENLTGNPSLDHGFEAGSIDLTGGRGGDGEPAVFFDADGGPGGDGGHLYLDGGRFILGDVNLSGGAGGEGGGTGEGGNGGSGGYVQLEGNLVGQGVGQTSTITLLGGRAGEGSDDFGEIGPGSAGNSGVISVRLGAHWISSDETGIFNVDLSSTQTGFIDGFEVGRGDAGTFYVTGGTVEWLAGEIDISNLSGDSGGLFEMTGGEFTLAGGTLNMEHYPLYEAGQINLFGGTFNFGNGSINLGGQESPGGPSVGDGGLLNLDGGTLKTSQQWFDQFHGRFDFKSGTLHLTDSQTYDGQGWLIAVEARGGLFDNRTLIVDGNITKNTSSAFNITDDGELTIGSTFYVASGIFNMIGGRATIGRLNVDDDVDFIYEGGELTLTNGTTDFRTLYDSAFDAPEGGIFTVRSGATFQVGAIDGEGDVAIESGGTIDVTGDAVFGFVSDTTNTLTVTGSGSELIAGDDLFVGYSDGATTYATISDGGNIRVTDLTTIGFNGGSFGKITVDNGELETDSLRVSDVGSGELHIIHGGQVEVAGEANVGWWTGSNGFVLLEDAGSELEVDGNFYIGRRGRGEMAINDGAEASMQLETTLGSYAGSHGALFLDGAGSILSTDSLVVSDVGYGYVSVSNGASLLVGAPESTDNSGDIRIGLSDDSDGIVEVQNAGSRIDIDDDFFVGVDGEGELNVTDGGIVDINGDLTLAVNAGSTGTVTIDSGGKLYVRQLKYGDGTSTLNFINGTLGLTAYNLLDSATMTSLGINNLNSNQTIQLGDGVSLFSAVTFDAAGTLQFGTLNMINGSLDVEGEVISIGRTIVGASSRINVQGGSYHSFDTLEVGADSGTASQLNVSSGQLNFSDGFNLATDPGDAAEFSVSGGAVSGDTLTMGTGAIFTQSGGTIQLTLPGDPTANGGEMIINGGQVNLTGGTLALAVPPYIAHINSPAGGRLEINGGNVDLAGGTIDLSGEDNLFGEAGEAGGVWLNGGTLTLVSGNIVMAPGPGQDSAPRPAYGNLIINGGTLNVDPDTVAGIVDGELDFRTGTIHMRTEYGVGITTGAIADELGNAHLTLGSGQKITTEGNFSVAANGGATATLSNSAMVTVGADALVGDTPDTEGTLTIQSGSSMVTAGEVIIGRNGGSPGETNVQGAGSRLNVGTQLVVSDGGHGALNIMSGGKVESAGDTNIGWWHDSDGEVTVAGTDSELEVNGALTVGTRGEGTLTIGTGGEVQAYVAAQPVTLADNAAATGTLILDGGNLDIHTLVVGSGTASTDLRSGRIRFTGQQVIDAEMVDLLGLDGLAADGVELQMLNHAQITGSGADVILAGGTWDLTSHNLEVLAGASIGGSGTIDGAVTIDSNSSINPGNSPGTLTVEHLALSAGSTLNFELATPGVVGSGVNDLIDIEDDLVLDGILNVTALDGFGAGTYQLMSIGGSLTQDNGLQFGSMPSGYDFELSTLTPGQVNLVVSAVPEPASFAVVMGLMALTWTKTRRRRLHPPRD